MTCTAASPMAGRTKVFFALCFALVLVTGGYIYLSAGRLASTRRPVEYAVGSVVRGAHVPPLATLRKQPHVAFRNLVPGAGYGMLAYVSLDSPGGPREETDLPCQRLYASAGVTVCLGPYQGYWSGHVLNDRLEVGHIFRAPGVPSRVRVSRDGRLAGYTLFTAADSYMVAGFSTRSVLVDTESGARIADLESFDAWKDNAPFHAVDFNYWGVTFGSDPAKFFATLGTAGHTYLVEGDVANKRMTVVADGVECPSLSPDETRIAFKKKTEMPGRWRPAIFDLKTRADTVLPETRNLDDQIEWLDDEHVLYAIAEPGAAPVRSSVWKLRIDGSQPPTLFIADAASPAIVRQR